MNNGEARVANNLAYADHKKVRAGQPLCPQEKRAVELMADGLTNREIGQHMGLAEGTIKVYLSRAVAKMNMSGRTRYKLIARQWEERVLALEQRLQQYEVVGTS